MKQFFKGMLIIIILFTIFGCADSNSGNEVINNNNNHNDNNNIIPTPVPTFLWKDTFGKVLPTNFPVLLEVLNSYTETSNVNVKIYSGAAINISESEYNDIKNKLKIYYSSLLKEECKIVTPETGTICNLSASKENNGIKNDFLLTHHRLLNTLSLSYTVINIH